MENGQCKQESMMKKSKWIQRMVLPALAVLSLAVVGTAHATYSLVDLGETATTGVTGINNAGQVAGTISHTDGTRSAAIYTGGAWQDLGKFGSANAGASGINNNGQVLINTFDVPASSYWTYIYDFKNGGQTTVAQTSGVSGGKGINDAGQVVLVSNSRLLIYKNNNVTDIGTMGLYSVSSAIINNAGKVAGYGKTSSTGYYATKIADLDGTNYVDVGNLGYAKTTYVYGMNDSGQVVGNSTYSRLSNYKAYRYDGTIHDLSNSNWKYSIGNDINNNDQIVGTYTDTNSGVNGAFFWENGGAQDISNLFAAQGWILTNAKYINDNGDIVGFGDLNGVSHQFLLLHSTPTPIPPAFYMFGSGLIGLMGARRKFSRG